MKTEDRESQALKTARRDYSLKLTPRQCARGGGGTRNVTGTHVSWALTDRLSIEEAQWVPDLMGESLGKLDKCLTTVTYT